MTKSKNGKIISLRYQQRGAIRSIIVKATFTQFQLTRGKSLTCHKAANHQRDK